MKTLTIQKDFVILLYKIEGQAGPLVYTVNFIDLVFCISVS